MPQNVFLALALKNLIEIKGCEIARTMTRRQIKGLNNVGCMLWFRSIRRKENITDVWCHPAEHASDVKSVRIQCTSFF